MLYREFHKKYIAPKRVTMIKEEILDILPQGEISDSWLDIGSRGGEITHAIYNATGGRIESVETLDICDVKKPLFKHTVYDGKTIPFPEMSFDLVSFIDVLHHTRDITHLLTEAKRVSKRHILIKDHKYEKQWHVKSLKIQDWFGNVGTGCPLFYNFLNYNEWQAIFDNLELKVLKNKNFIKFNYPFPFNIIYPDSLHFVCLLQK